MQSRDGGCLIVRMFCGLECFSSRYVFFFQAEDGIRDLVRSRGLGDVYKRQLRCRGYVPVDCHAACARRRGVRSGIPGYDIGLVLSLIHI